MSLNQRREIEVRLEPRTRTRIAFALARWGKRADVGDGEWPAEEFDGSRQLGIERVVHELQVGAPGLEQSIVYAVSALTPTSSRRY